MIDGDNTDRPPLVRAAGRRRAVAAGATVGGPAQTRTIFAWSQASSPRAPTLGFPPLGQASQGLAPPRPAGEC